MDNNNTDIPRPNVPDHELLRCIGRGSYGEVWLARNLFGVFRAVKIVHRKEDGRLFERELAGIYKFEPISRSHEGFVDILHIGRNDEAGYFYYVMELADDRQTGQKIDPERYVPMTLGRNSRPDPKLPIEECLKLALSLTSALSQLHKAHLVHRDIKPSNIIVLNGVPKLADIGLVAGIDDARSSVGTEGFIPLEGPGSPRADIFSLGKVLYEISTGEDRRAFPVIPKGCANAAFLELNEVIVKASHTDVHQRYQTADEMYADLAVLLNGKSVKRLRLLERRVAWLTRAGVAAAIILVVFGLGYFEFERERKHRTEIRQREMGSQTAHGVEALDQGQLMQALPPFVDVFRLDEPKRTATHRTRIHMILQQCPKLVQMWSNVGRVNDGEFSRDGRFLALASRTNGVQVVDTETGKSLGPTFGPPGLLHTVCFSPDGGLILAASEDRTATLWDWRTGRRVLVLADSNMVFAATFSLHGDRIVTACSDGVARVWNSSTGTLLMELKGHAAAVAYATFSPDDKLIFTAGRDNAVLIWDAADGKFLNRRLRHKSWVNAFSFSPDGSRLATACADKTAYVWDLATDKEVFVPLSHRDVVVSVQFSPDGLLILTGCLDSTARLWDATTGAPVAANSVLRHASRVLHAGFHRDGHRIITTCLDGISCLWDLAGSCATPVPRHALLSPNGVKFLMQGDSWVQAGNTKNNQMFPRIPLESPLREVSWSRNGRYLLTLSPAKQADTNGALNLAVWESETGNQISIWPDFKDTLERVVLSDDARRMVCFWTSAAKLYDLRTLKAISPWLPHKRVIRAGIFNPQGDDLVTVDQNDIYVWNLKTGELRFKRSFALEVKAGFSSKGQLLVTYCRDDTLTECEAQIWDAATGEPTGTALRHRDGVCSTQFSPKDDLVLTASEDATALIWDRINHREPKELRHRDEVHEACFNPDGSWALTVSRDKTARLWDVATGEPISPPLPHPVSLQHGAFLDAQAFLTSDDNSNAWVWEPGTNSWPVEDLVLLAGLLNGNRPSARGPAGVRETAYTVWLELKAKHPDDFTTIQQHLIAWHWQQAALAQDKDQLLAALLHYDRLLALQPGDQEVIRSRVAAEKRLKARESSSLSLHSPQSP